MLGTVLSYPSDEGYPCVIGSDPPEPSLPAIRVGVLAAYYTTYLALHFLNQSVPAAAKTANYGQGPSSSGDKPNSQDQMPLPIGRGHAAEDRSILFTGSVLSYRSIRRVGEYCMAKAAIRGLFKTLRAEDHSTIGVRVNFLAPNYVDTPIYPQDLDTSKYRFTQMKDVTHAMVKVTSDPQIDGE